MDRNLHGPALVFEIKIFWTEPYFEFFTEQMAKNAFKKNNNNNKKILLKN